MFKHRTGAVVAAAALVLGLGACSTINPIQTQTQYNAADGVLVDIGDTVRAQNLLLLAADAESPALLIGNVVNDSKESVDVQIIIDGTTVFDTNLEAGAHESITPDAGNEVLITPTPNAPGAFVEVTVSTSTAGEETISVPVLDGTLKEYRELIP